MKDEPDIVKQLREEERSGGLVINGTSFLKMDFSKDEKENHFLKESQDRNESSDEEHKIIFNNAKEMLLYLDRMGRIIKINQAGLDFSGFRKEEVLGKKFWKLPGVFSPKNIPKLIKIFNNSLNVEKTEKNLELKDNSGKKHKMNVSNYPVFKNNKVEYIIVIAEDVTEKKKTEEKYKELFNNALVGISVHDKSGYIINVNDTAERIFGIKKEELKKKDLDFWVGKLFKPDGKPMDISEFPLSVVSKDKSPRENKIVGLSMSKDDDIKWYLLSDRPIFDDDGNIEKIVTCFVDITNQILLEKNFEIITENSADAIFITDRNGCFVYVNNTANTLLKYSKAEFKKMNITDISKKEDIKSNLNKFKDLINQGSFSTELELVKKNGQIISVDLNAVVLPNGLIYGSCRDITDRKRSEIALKESEERYRRIVELSPDGIVILDLEGNVKSCNKMAEKILCCSSDELVGKKFYEVGLKDKEYVSYYKNTFLSIIKRGTDKKFEMDIKRKNGTVFTAEIRVGFLEKDGKKVGLQAVFRDITQRKKNETEIRKFKTIADKAKYGVNILKLDGTMTYVNNAFAKMHGYKKEEIIGKNHDILHTNEEINKKINDARDKLRKGGYVFLKETHVKKDGTKFPVSVNASVVNDEDGNPFLIAGVVTDISKQKRIEKKLAESEKLFRKLVEQSLIGVYIFDPIENNLFYANPLIKKTLNISEDDVEKVNLYDYLHPDDKKLVKERTRKRLSGEDIDPSVEVRLFPPDGEMRWVRVYTNFIRYKGRIAALASVIDITDRKKARLKIRKHVDELERYKDATIGRELRVVELKREINQLYKNNGLPVKYEDTDEALKKHNYREEDMK